MNRDKERKDDDNRERQRDRDPEHRRDRSGDRGGAKGNDPTHSGGPRKPERDDD